MRKPKISKEVSITAGLTAVGMVGGALVGYILYLRDSITHQEKYKDRYYFYLHELIPHLDDEGLQKLSEHIDFNQIIDDGLE